MTFPNCCDMTTPTYTESWRRETEARYVLKFRKDHRERYYREVGLKRGLPASRQLIDDVKVEYSKRA